MRGISINKKKLFTYFIIIDALFFPYIRSLHASVSMILILVWGLIHLPMLLNMKCFKIVIGIYILIITSVLRGIVVFPKYISANITGMMILLFCLLYYVYFYIELKNNEINIIPIFYAQIIFSAILAMYYLVNPQGYFNIRSIWTMSGSTITYYEAIYSRFTFLQSDPNNNGCIICAMMLYIFQNEKNISSVKRVVLMILVGISVFASISTTGFIVYFLSIGLYVASKNGYRIRRYEPRYVKPFNFIMTVAIAIALVMVVGLVFTNRISFSFDLISTMKERFKLTTSGGTMSGRIDIWSEILNTFNWYQYIILGRGDTLIDRYGNVHAAHNGHIHMVLAYGMVAYMTFLYLFFRKCRERNWKSYIPMIPLFLLFSINTLIIDFRATIALSLIAATYHNNLAEAVENRPALIK